MQGLLERVKFLGGSGGAEQEPEPDTLETGPELSALPDQDPEPSPAVRAKPRNSRPSAAAKPTGRAPRNGGKFVSKAQVQKDLADELNMWLKLWAGMWSLSDEVCAGVLNDTSAVIAQDIANLAARSDWVMDKFQTTSLLGDIGKAIVHGAPLIKAMWRHHGPGAQERALAEQEEAAHEGITVVDPTRYGPWRP